MIDVAAFVKLDFYRFIMIFGFVISVLSWGAPEYVQFKLNQQKIYRETELESLDDRMKLDSMLTKMNDTFDMIALDNLKLKIPTEEELKAAEQRIRESTTAEFDKNVARSAELKKLKKSAQLDTYISERLSFYRCLSLIGMAIGLSMFVFGLWRWFLIQLLLDKKMKAEIDKKDQ